MKKTFLLLICLLLCACSSSQYNNNDNNNNNIESCNNNSKPYASKIYVISLDRTPERFSFVKNQLDEQNIKCEKFKAIDGYNLDFQNTETGKFLNAEEKKNFHNYSWENKPVKYNVVLGGCPLMQVIVNKVRFSLGEVGVACSHREIWKEMIKNNYDSVIIFEDDVILDKNFKSNLQEYMADLPNDWDIAFLGVGRRNNKYGYFVCVGEIFRDIDNVENHPFVAKIQPTNLVYGMHGYIINQRGARKLLNLTNTSDYPIDDIVFQQGGINTGKVKGYVAMKKMVEQKLNDSEIKRMGRSY